MRGRKGKYMVLLVLLLTPLACAKLSEEGWRAPGTATIEVVPSSETIPLQWGRLVSVTGELPVEKLWFQNDAGELRVVGFDHRSMRLDSLSVVIHRN